MKTNTLLIAAVVGLAADAGAATTHMGQKIEDHVVLTMPSPGASCPAVLHRVKLDGTLFEQPFHLPVNRALVVTDVDWSAFPGEFSDPGDSVRLQIMLRQVAPHAVPSFQSSSIIRGRVGVPGSSEQLTTGFVVGAGATICAIAGDGLQSEAQVETLVLRGYLIAVPLTRGD
jgi:hypothetical protein